MAKNLTHQAQATAEIKKLTRKTMAGIVVSDKMKDTIVVEVSRFIKHPKYGKYVSINKKFKAHDAGNTKKIGDKVTIEECAPISKDKKFRVV
jgi:small subunit ribosomal protein S17